LTRRKEAKLPFGLPADPAFQRLLAERGVNQQQFGQWVQAELQRFFQDLTVKAQKEGPSIQIPITLISQQQIGNVGAVALYLRDTQACTVPQIAQLLNRSMPSIAASLRKGERQAKGKVLWSAEDFCVPIAVLADAKLSMCEAVVAYLREQCHLHPWRIAQMLQRDQRVIATIWQRVLAKRRAQSEVHHG